MAGFHCLTFLTDYGLEDAFVAICHGLSFQIAPDVRIIDETHQVLCYRDSDGWVAIAVSEGDAGGQLGLRVYQGNDHRVCVGEQATAVVTGRAAPCVT